MSAVYPGSAGVRNGPAFDRAHSDHYHSAMGRLVMVSNRVPAVDDLDPAGKGAGAVGGLVSSVRASLVQTGGLWMGWSGRATQRRPQSTPAVNVTDGPVQLATIDLTTDESNLFYTGFSNRTLWPLLHSFTERAQIRQDTYRAYRRVNRKYAQALISLSTKTTWSGFTTTRSSPLDTNSGG